MTAGTVEYTFTGLFIAGAIWFGPKLWRLLETVAQTHIDFVKATQAAVLSTEESGQRQLAELKTISALIETNLHTSRRIETVLRVYCDTAIDCAKHLPEDDPIRQELIASFSRTRGLIETHMKGNGEDQ